MEFDKISSCIDDTTFSESHDRIILEAYGCIQIRWARRGRSEALADELEAIESRTETLSNGQNLTPEAGLDRRPDGRNSKRGSRTVWAG
jgi:hypothetical protein